MPEKRFFPGAGILLAHRPTHALRKLAIKGLGLADAGSVAATPSLESHTEGY